MKEARMREQEDWEREREKNKGIYFTELVSAVNNGGTIPPRTSENCIDVSKKKVKMLVSQSCLTLCNPMDCSPADSSVHGTVQAEYWNVLPFPSSRDLSDSGIEPWYPTLQAVSLPSESFLQIMRGCCAHPLLSPFYISWELQQGHFIPPPRGAESAPLALGKTPRQKNWAILLVLEAQSRKVSVTARSKIKAWRGGGWGNPVASTKPFSCQK